MRVAKQDQSRYVKDLKAVFGRSAKKHFKFDSDNNLTLTVQGVNALFEGIDAGGDRGDLYAGVLKLMTEETVTNVVYVKPKEPIKDPKTEQPYQLETSTGDKIKVTSSVDDLSGEATVLANPAKPRKSFIGVTENTIFVSKKQKESFLKDGGKKGTTTRAERLFHGMGHVLFPKNSEQHKVIDFENKARNLEGKKDIPVDSQHKSSKDVE